MKKENFFLLLEDDGIDFSYIDNLRLDKTKEQKLKIKNLQDFLDSFISRENIVSEEIDLENFIIHPEYIAKQNGISIREITDKELEVSNLLNQILTPEKDLIDFSQIDNKVYSLSNPTI